MKLLSISLSVSLFTSLSASLSLTNHFTRQDPTPNAIVIDGPRLVENKERLQANDPVLLTALENLIIETNSWLDQGPWTVINKTQ